jgi:uncharacterized protein YbbC (DUF1343 family)
VAFRAARFRPEFGKHGGRVCAGIEIHVVDRDRLEPVALGLVVLKALHDIHPDDFGWRPDSYEFVADIPALDLLTGSADARHRIENGEPFDELLESWRRWVSGWEATLDGVLLYHDR